ncbi:MULTISPECIES: hypothetical protein [Pseudomonas]|uniref:hypothetical protein n=1 Tax=Pseudomonas TaxID=286 RepID=UPI0003B9B81C|nr:MULTISPECIES: hypothetical protein [Pseudomonas]EKJ9725168.1 hypothetical protein [Pseudomonas aeruginosa]EKV4568862.1 hypothetical protein [Pseudomonas aeruginosa]EKW8363536.1 hypothetical protein [Pseudomonas aeruginosa]ELQ7310997.1 hypothetical protein [Pseudomonas aeruginosa]ELQ7317328.1 hypothetical protein [Pseudomonas aeruginosa]
MRNAITYTALAAFLALGVASAGFTEEAKAPAQSSSSTTTGEDMHMMDGKQMPMMDMMQEMSTMMKNCNAMMEHMDKHAGQEAPKDGSKAQ